MWCQYYSETENNDGDEERNEVEERDNADDGKRNVVTYPLCRHPCGMFHLSLG